MRRRFVVVLVLMVCLTTFSGGILAHAQEREKTQPIYYKYYTSIQVKEGDTLWEIADRYLCGQGTSRDAYIQEIMQINGLKGDTIRTGQYLTVVYYSTDYK